MTMDNPTTGTVAYTLHTVRSDSPHIADIAARFREVKLSALLAAPSSFAMRHADEVLLPLEYWQGRLALPSTMMVCVETPSSSVTFTSDKEALLLGRWIGMVTLRGPVPYSEYHIPESGQPVPQDPDTEARWYICNLYTAEAFRGRGIGKVLLNACVELSKQRTKALQVTNVSRVRIRLFCGAFMTALYKKMGFDEAGRVTLRDGFRANGDATLIPKDTTSTEELLKLWETRYGVAMERIIEV
ncbi:hypothetical protein M011DRAFT_476082 [Sporormia fimetaria CBS 119925]|uniref:N-acetyltransferase domain-containing protein n=1 Tax=Sporormia fimetaria CBS 119925 TaxID=1340428 RepID=A0A6A6VDP8_9PLEO|nr:hypothetical protein M011DRAFT_476082 [Sporormia fimetaria CBS 119925]